MIVVLAGILLLIVILGAMAVCVQWALLSFLMADDWLGGWIFVALTVVFGWCWLEVFQAFFSVDVGTR